MAPRTADSVRKLRDNVVESIRAQKDWITANVNTDKSVRELKRRIAFVEDKYNDFKQLDEELLLLNGDESNACALEVEALFLLLTSQFETLLDEIEGDNNSDASSSYHSFTRPTRERQVKYPKLSMPEFHGEPEEWSSFIERFNLAVKGLHPLTQFECLLPCLKNGSDSGIKHLSVTEKNYPEALRILRRRYDNKILNLRRHLRQLFDLPTVLENNPGSLRQLVDCSTSNVRAIENLGHKRDKLSDELLSLLVSTKIDLRTKELYETTLAEKLQEKDNSDNADNDTATNLDAEDTFSFLVDFLESRLQVVSAVFDNESASQSSKSKSTTASPRSKSIATSAALTSNNTTGGGGGDPTSTTVFRPCSLCNKPHALYMCAEFKKLGVDDRYKHVRDQKLCVNCFASGHWSKDCNSSKCKTCGGTHHTLLHPA